MRWFPLAVLAAASLTADTGDEIPFQRHTLDLGRSEACAVADVNGDGKLDVISGESWYEGPTWTKHRFRQILYWNNYYDDFSDLPLDVDSDGDVDVISVGWAGRKSIWLENPGKGQGQWKEHAIDSGHPIEFAFLADLDNDGKRDELLPQYGGAGGFTAWYEPEGKGGGLHWKRYIVSPQAYGHGIGAGDLNGDGRTDILTPKGWLEAPADPRSIPWAFHGDFAFDKHVGFLHVLDVDGDGLNDVVAPHAHDYGIYWLKQSPPGKFERKLIDDAWSQAHATTLADLTGDGFPELVTGKRFYAHNGHDAGGREPLGLYWYGRFEGTQGPEWSRHVLHYGGRVGGGMQIPVIDIDHDGDLDIVVAGKGGLYLFENQTR